MSETPVSDPGQPGTSEHRETGQHAVRPIGAWVVGGFLLLAVLATWILVAVIFQARA